MTIDHVVVVGSSVGGIHAAQALRAGGFDGELVVVGAESAAPYDKPPLSKQSLTEADADIGLLRADDEFGLRLGVAATGLNPARKEIVLADGQPISYDALIIATGARARMLPGTDKELVRPLRELKDAATLRARLTGSGLPLGDGVYTDDSCAVRGTEGVYAIGDVARWYDPAGGVTRRVEHWTNATASRSRWSGGQSLATPSRCCAMSRRQATGTLRCTPAPASSPQPSPSAGRGRA